MGTCYERIVFLSREFPLCALFTRSPNSLSQSNVIKACRPARKRGLLSEQSLTTIPHIGLGISHFADTLIPSTRNEVTKSETCGLLLNRAVSGHADRILGARLVALLSIDAIAWIFMSMKKIENQSRARIKSDKILKMYNAGLPTRKYAA